MGSSLPAPALLNCKIFSLWFVGTQTIPRLGRALEIFPFNSLDTFFPLALGYQVLIPIHLKIGGDHQHISWACSCVRCALSPPLSPLPRLSLPPPPALSCPVVCPVNSSCPGLPGLPILTPQLRFPPILRCGLRTFSNLYSGAVGGLILFTSLFQVSLSFIAQYSMSENHCFIFFVCLLLLLFSCFR